jgi:hypothetical protein
MDLARFDITAANSRFMIKRTIESITVPFGRFLWPPIAWLRWAVWSGLLAAVIGAVVATSVRFDINRDCKGGSFSSGFSGGFDIRRCGVDIEYLPTGERITIPLPPSWL